MKTVHYVIVILIITNQILTILKKREEREMPAAETIGMISAGLGAVEQAGNILGIGQKKQDKRQIEQQRKLSEQEREIQHKAQMDMWHATNYGPQVEELKKAGLNPGLLYGKGGGGGTTVGGGISGGQASGAAATQSANTQSQGMGLQAGLMAAQIKLMEAQAKKAEVEANKTAGVDTGIAEANKASIEFQNKLNQEIGIDDMKDRYSWSNEILERRNAKELAEYNAWYATGFEGKENTDPTSPIAKAMTAGLKITLEQLEAAKLANDGARAGLVVKEFEARLTKEGIHPQSPWYTKIIMDMLQKSGITGKTGFEEGLKLLLK